MGNASGGMAQPTGPLRDVLREPLDFHSLLFKERIENYIKLHYIILYYIMLCYVMLCYVICITYFKYSLHLASMGLDVCICDFEPLRLISM